MSEMSEPSAGSGSPDAPSTGQPSAAGDQTANALEQPPPQMVSAPGDDGPPPAEGTSKLVEPGKAAVPASTDAPQTAGAPKPAPPGKATAAVRTDAPQAVSGKAPTTAIHPQADPMALRQLLDELAKRGTGGGGSALSELAALRALYPFERVLCRDDGSIATVSGRTIWLFRGNQFVNRALRAYSSVEAPPLHSIPAAEFRIGADGVPQLLSPDDRGPVDATLSPDAYAIYRFMRDSDVTEGESVGAITAGVMIATGVPYERAIQAGRAIGGIVGAHYGFGGEGKGQTDSRTPEVDLVERTTLLGEEARPGEVPTASVRSPSEAVPEIRPSPEPTPAISAKASEPVFQLASLWARLAARAEEPQARQSTGGFRSQSVTEGRYTVMILEGPVGEQIAQTYSLARGSWVLPGEHGAHGVGMQIGENLAEGVASAPPPLNLGPLKMVENATRAVYERVKATGGQVETRTLLQIETRSVGGEDVPVLHGVQRQSWIVMPGTDKTIQFVDFAASVDPVTRFVTEHRKDIRKPAR